MIPKLPVDFNSDSAFETLKFISDHYEELMSAYKDIMEHLKLPVSGGSSESPFEVVTSTNPKPMYITLRFVDSLPSPYRTSCYFGAPKFEDSSLENYAVSSSYIKDLVGAPYTDEIVPQNYQYNYFLRIYRDGTEIDYEEYSSLRYSDYAEDWEGLELRLGRLNLYAHDDTEYEDLGEFVSAIEALFTPVELELKPTSEEILRGLSIMDENYLISETDTPYTYAVDCCKYNGQYLKLNGGTYSNIGTVDSSGRYSGFLGVESACSATSGEANHFYVNVLIDTNGYPYFKVETYRAEEDNTSFTFTRLVPKV